MTDYFGRVLSGYDKSEFRSSELMEIARPFDARVHHKAISKSMRRMGYHRKQVTSGADKGHAIYVSPTANGWN